MSEPTCNSLFDAFTFHEAVCVRLLGLHEHPGGVVFALVEMAFDQARISREDTVNSAAFSVPVSHKD